MFSEPDGSQAQMADFLTGFGTGPNREDVLGKPVGLTTDEQGRLYLTSDTRSSVVLRIDHSQVSGTWEHALPDSIPVGGSLAAAALVRLLRLAEGEGELRVTADLSAFGGPADLDLSATADSTFQLDTALPVEGPLGPRTVSVLIEQEAGGSIHRLLLPHTIAVVAAVGAAWEHSLPDSVFAGSRLRMRAQVRLQRWQSDRGLPRVSADLSAFGGPADAPLTAVGDSTYQLDIPLDITGLTGARTLFIRVEQDPVEEAFRLLFSKTIAVLPGGDESIVDDGLAANWQVAARLGAAPPLATAAGPVFRGETASALEVAWERFADNWEVDFTPVEPVQAFGYKALRLAFHPGDIEGPSFSSIAVNINGFSTDLVRGDPAYQVDLERPEWQVVEIPMSEFSILYDRYPTVREESVDFIEFVRFSGNVSGTFYLDDIRLVSAVSAPPTAVFETRQDDVPERFELAQNFPNPFNSQTVIRFSLPAASAVELAVYNLAGQRLARLVAGERSAGTYAVRWDGRDGQSRQLASGVYLYRLRAGGAVITRKLSLLR